MPISKRIARFNRHVTNPVMRHVAGWMPGFGIVTHVGRRTGRPHETPVNVFRRGDRYVFALTYGADSEWVQNVVAAGECELRTERRTVHLVDPHRFADPSRALVPAPARWVLARIDVEEFLSLRPQRP